MYPRFRFLSSMALSLSRCVLCTRLHCPARDSRLIVLSGSYSCPFTNDRTVFTVARAQGCSLARLGNPYSPITRNSICVYCHVPRSVQPLSQWHVPLGEPSGKDTIIVKAYKFEKFHTSPPPPTLNP